MTDTYHNYHNYVELQRSERLRIIEMDLATLRRQNAELRKIAAHVPGSIYIAAKEAAGFGDAVRAQSSEVKP